MRCSHARETQTIIHPFGENLRNWFALQQGQGAQVRVFFRLSWPWKSFRNIVVGSFSLVSGRERGVGPCFFSARSIEVASACTPPVTVVEPRCRAQFMPCHCHVMSRQGQGREERRFRTSICSCAKFSLLHFNQPPESPPPPRDWPYIL